MTYHIAQHEHSHAHAARRDERAAAHFEQLLEAEFESQGEEQEDDTNFGPLVHRLYGGDAEQTQVRPHDETCYDITQDQRLLECFGYDGKESGRNQDDGQVFYKIQFFCHIFVQIDR